MTIGSEMKKPQYIENLITTTTSRRRIAFVALGHPLPGLKNMLIL